MNPNFMRISLSLALSVLTNSAFAFTIEDYNRTLIESGVSWKTSRPTYFPAFYTGFAPRIENPNRIHFQLSRGNQIRLTAPLDDFSVLTYMYNLKERENLVNRAVSEGVIATVHQDQFKSYQAVLASDQYGVNSLAKQFSSNAISRADFYAQSLNAIQKLNQGRVFQIRINLTTYINRWKVVADAFNAAASSDLSGYVAANQQKTITLLNELVPGRVNIFSISPNIKNKLIETLAVSGNLAAFEIKTLELFKLATDSRYDFKVLRNGQLQPSIYKNSTGELILEYPEFTAIYPNGSVKDYTKDRDGNQIPIIQETGVMNYVARSYHDVDHIRSEPFYGYAPKMDYTNSGNGIHNPAVRTNLRSSIYKGLFGSLNIPSNHDTLWIISRGGVSHGCTRLSAGHILEVRNIFPASSAQMSKLNYFGNVSQDYDLFDIDGNGTPEVMGVKYFMAYAIASDSGEGYREGAGLIEQSLDRDKFYGFLYGQKQFRIENGKYIFINPYISQFLKSKEGAVRGGAFSLQISGEYELYEQNYEKDKMQFFAMSNDQFAALAGPNDNTSSGKQLVRIFGRATSCGPLKNEFANCYEDQYKAEVDKLFPTLSKVK